MAKQTTTTERPRPLDVLTSITEQVLAFRYTERQPNLVDIGRTVLAASRAMHIKDLDERISAENAVTLAIARRRQLIS